MAVLCELYGTTAAVAFGPLALRAIQQKLIADGLARRTINQMTHQVVRTFKGGVSVELLAVSTYQTLATVPGLRRGRTNARETMPVQPVDDQLVDATAPHLPPIIADMVRFQRLSGCRPGEVCRLRPIDVDRSSDVWKYVPVEHKTEHHGKTRIVFIGPKAQEVLLPYLLRPAEAFCFSPAESVARQRKDRQATRKTPLSCGNRPGSNRKRRPARAPALRYTVDSYRRAITRAVTKANDAAVEAVKEAGEAHAKAKLLPR